MNRNYFDKARRNNSSGLNDFTTLKASCTPQERLWDGVLYVPKIQDIINDIAGRI